MLGFGYPQALLGLAALLPIVLLYVWVRRRPRLTVSYLAIWQRVAQQQARRGWLRWLVSLLLALTTATALALAATGLGAEPDDDAGPPAPPRHVVVLLDTSPSAWADGWAAPGTRDWAHQRLMALRAEVAAVPGGTLTLAWQEPAGLHTLPLERVADEAALARTLAAVEPLYAPPAGPNWAALVEAAQQRVQHAMAVAVATPAPAGGSSAGSSGSSTPEGVSRPDIRWLMLSDGQPLPAPWQPLTGQPATWRFGTAGDGVVAQVWRPAVPAGRMNAAIVDVRYEPRQPDRLRVTVAASPPPTAGLRQTPPALELVSEPAIAPPIPLEWVGDRLRPVSLPLPAAVPTDARRGATAGGPDTWTLMLAVRPRQGEAAADARPADDAVTLTLPVREPTPLVVLGPQAREPLLRLLLATLQEQGVARVVTRQQAAAQGLEPVVLLAGQAWAAAHAFPAGTRGVIAVAGPAAAGATGRRLEPGTMARVADQAPGGLAELAEVAVTIREARAVPDAPGRVPLILAGGVPIADFVPGTEDTPARVRFGFGWSLAETDLLAQPTVAPVLLARLIRLLAPPRRSPLPLVAAVGSPLGPTWTALHDEVPADAWVTVALPGESAAPPVPLTWLLHHTSAAWRPLAEGGAEAGAYDTDADGRPLAAVEADARTRQPAAAAEPEPEPPRWTPCRPGVVEVAVGSHAWRQPLRWRTVARLFSATESRLLSEAAATAHGRALTPQEPAPLFAADDDGGGGAAGEPHQPDMLADGGQTARTWPWWYLLAAAALLLVLVEAVLYRLRLTE